MGCECGGSSDRCIIRRWINCDSECFWSFWLTNGIENVRGKQEFLRIIYHL